MKRLLSLAVVLVSVAQPHAVLAAGSVQQIKTEKDAKPETGATFKPAPYDDKLVQLAEILGSLDFIRNLCERGTEPQWKTMMGQLLDSDAKEEPARREKLTAAYNRGYEHFPPSRQPAVRNCGQRPSVTVSKAQHSPRKSPRDMEINELFTSFPGRPCRIGKRLLMLLRER